MNILIFSVAAGGGHNAVANAIKKNLLEKDEKTKVQVVDTLSYINKALHKVIIGSYLETIKYVPKLYGHLYENTESWDSILSNIGEFSYKILALKLKKLIEEFAPDKILCTHPFPSEILAGLKKNNKIQAEVINVLTDFTVHTMWINKGVDTYIVAASGLQFYMESFGVDLNRVKPLGIPVRKEFGQIKEKYKIREELNLQHKTTILIMGGSLGVGDIKNTVKSLLSSPLDIQFLIVCGENERLYKQLYKYKSEEVHIYQFIENVYDLMDASDLIITKPGGITISEALCKELPIVFISPIPGQEVRNIEFLLNNGVGVKAKDENEIVPLIRQLMEDPDRMELMKKRCSQMKKPNAGSEIADYILQQ